MVNRLKLETRVIALLMCSALAVTGCATTGRAAGVGARTAGGRITDRDVLAEYVQRLPPGSVVRVERAKGPALRGTLMKATGQSLIIQPRTRVPEPAVEVALSEVLSVVPDPPNNGAMLGKAIGVGAAAGAGAALAVFFIIVAMVSD
jgi:hypothetical protein